MSASAPPVRFDGRVAVVTGAGRGLGREHAVALASRGARVVVNDVDAEAAAGTAELLAGLGASAVADTHSVATPDGGAAVVATAIESFGRIDVVVNNAGILADAMFHKMRPESLDAVLDVHLRGAFWVTRPAWERMREQRYGRVVNTTSAAGLLGNAGQANYAAAKMGLVGLTRALAAEGGRVGIRVNAVAPLALTPMSEAVLGSFGGKLHASLVSPVVAWLCSEQCSVTGEVLSAGGGRVARYFVGLTRGWSDPELTPEGVRDNLGAICDEQGYEVPAAAAEEVARLMALLG